MATSTRQPCREGVQGQGRSQSSRGHLGNEGQAEQAGHPARRQHSPGSQVAVRAMPHARRPPAALAAAPPGKQPAPPRHRCQLLAAASWKSQHPAGLPAAAVARRIWPAPHGRAAAPGAPPAALLHRWPPPGLPAAPPAPPPPPPSAAAAPTGGAAAMPRPMLHLCCAARRQQHPRLAAPLLWLPLAPLLPCRKRGTRASVH